jgi:ribosomal protein S18 acetylase RimI-like enzyme
VSEFVIGEAGDTDIDALAALWTRCGLTRAWNDPRTDIAFARKSPNAAILVAKRDGMLVASVMVGHDGHRGWLYYVAVDPSLQRSGLGSRITKAAEDWLRQRGVQKVMLMVRPGNEAVQAFYQANGYEEQKRVILAKWLDGQPMTP